MSDPTTPTGKALLRVSSRHSAEVSWRVQADLPSSLRAIEREAAAAERERLREVHQSWEGHPSVVSSVWCGICYNLLADPEATDD